MGIIKKLYHFIFAASDTRVSFYVRLLFLCKVNNLPRVGLIVSRRLQRKYGVFISYKTVFDSTLILRHPTSIVIGEGVKLGREVKIFQNVTIGRSDSSIDAYPSIGDNTTIYAGAVVLGGIKIGKNCVVGANAVVTRDVPDNSVAVGVPAKIIVPRSP